MMDLPERKPFHLPTSIFIKTTTAEGKYFAHALDMDLMCSGGTEEEVVDRIKLCVRAYVEHGLSRGYVSDIHFPADPSHWEGLFSSDSTLKVLGEPIEIYDTRLLMLGFDETNQRTATALQAG